MLLHSALQYFPLVWFRAENVEEGVTEVVKKKSKMGGLVAGGAESMGELSCLSSFVLDQKKTHFSLFAFIFAFFPCPRQYLIPYRGFAKSLYDYTLTK